MEQLALRLGLHEVEGAAYMVTQKVEGLRATPTNKKWSVRCCGVGLGVKTETDAALGAAGGGGAACMATLRKERGCLYGNP